MWTLTWEKPLGSGDVSIHGSFTEERRLQRVQMSNSVFDELSEAVRLLVEPSERCLTKSGLMRKKCFYRSFAKCNNFDTALKNHFILVEAFILKNLNFSFFFSPLSIQFAQFNGPWKCRPYSIWVLTHIPATQIFFKHFQLVYHFPLPFHCFGPSHKILIKYIKVLTKHEKLPSAWIPLHKAGYVGALL